MADLIRMSGLVAARLARNAAPDAGALAQARPAERPGAEPPAGELAGPAAALELGKARGAAGDALFEQVRAGQENLAALESRAAAAEEVRGALAEARAGNAQGLAALGERVAQLAGRFEPGPELARLLSGVDPQAAAAVNPGLFQAAERETAGAAAAAQGQAVAERRGLATSLVAAENGAASRADVDRLERTAELLRKTGAPSEPAALVEALRGSTVNRGRALELLAGGAR
jgi:hypothetical protein